LICNKVGKWATGSLMFATGSYELSFWVPDLSKLGSYVVVVVIIIIIIIRFLPTVKDDRYKLKTFTYT